MKKMFSIFAILIFSMFFNAKIPNTPISKTKNIYLNISLHLEGTPYSQVSNYQRYERHIQGINQFIIPIKNENPKVKFNFELSHQFILQDIMHGETKFGIGNSFSKIQKAEGHSILIHADIGGQSESNTEYEYKLSRIISDFKTLMGEEPIGASGICGTNDWLGSLKNNGIKYITSLVEFCKKSIFKKKLAPFDWWVKSCVTPGSTVPENEIPWDPSIKNCHGIFPKLGKLTIRPFFMKNSRDWLKNINQVSMLNSINKKREILAFASMPIGKLTCLSNSATEATCLEDHMDIIEFENRLNDSLNVINNHNYKNNYLNFVLSVGEQYNPTYSSSIGKVLKDFTSDNNITWKSVEDSYYSFFKKHRIN